MSEGSPSKVRARKPLKDIARDLAVPVLIGLAAAGIGAASIASGLAARDQQAAQPSPAASASPSEAVCAATDRASLVPESGAMFGVNLDWHNRPWLSMRRTWGISLQ